eukprot:SAG31_NODE_23194_length_509_cov_0.873171_1_plen_94_part_00
MRADREIVLAAVKQSGRAIKHAAITLQMDPELLALACANYPHMLMVLTSVGAHSSIEQREIATTVDKLCADRKFMLGVLSSPNSDGMMLEKVR